MHQRSAHNWAIRRRQTGRKSAGSPKKWCDGRDYCAARDLLLLTRNKHLMSPLELRAVVDRVRGEFLEMPGLQLTPPQAARLWGLDLGSCEAVIDSLIRSAFLKRTASGAVTRVEQ